MRWNKVWTIFMKEYDEIIKNKFIIAGLVIMPVMFVLFIPATMYIPMFLDPESFSDEDLSGLLDFALRKNWEQLDELQRTFIIMTEFIYSMFLLIPVILPSIIAADSMSGEKERKTVEGIVASPITESEIYMGKIFGSMIPTTVVTWGSGIILAIIINIASVDILGYWYVPNLNFSINLFILGPLLSFAMINLTIWISSRTDTSRDAQQLSGLFILPVFLVFLNSIFLALIISELFLYITVLVVAALDFLLADFGMRLLDRERWLKYAS